MHRDPLCFFLSFLSDALNDMLQRSKQITVLRDLQAIRRYLMVRHTKQR